MGKFENIHIGDKAEIRHLITNEDIRKFVELTGDDNKLHVDETYAGTTSFKNTVAHGMLGASFISTIIGTKIPGDGALWFSQNIDFLLPVRVGDELTIKAEVLKKNDQLRTIEIQTDIYNQHKQKVTTGVAKVKIIEPEISQDKLLQESKADLKNVLVIGATGGIGRAICASLSKAGYNLVIHYNRNADGARKIQDEALKQGVNACMVHGDIRVKEEVEEILTQASRKMGEISAFVNCATLKLPSLKIEQLEWSDFLGHIEINVRANFQLAQALIPTMKQNKRGKFVFMTSQVTDNVPPAYWSFYTTAKYALNGFAKSLAVELAPFNVHVNLVSPGMTETDLIAEVPEKAKLLMAAKTPLRRLAGPDDVARAVLFLVSPESDYLTGETIRVNGGQTML